MATLISTSNISTEVQGSLKYEQQALKDASDKALREGRISEAQNHIDREIARWHGQRRHCPLAEYIRHRVRSDMEVGNDPPAEVIAAYPPATGPYKIAPGSSSYFPRGVPKDELAHFRKCYAHLIAAAKKKACAVSAAAGFGMAQLTAIFA